MKFEIELYIVHRQESEVADPDFVYLDGYRWRDIVLRRIREVPCFFPGEMKNQNRKKSGEDFCGSEISTKFFSSSSEDISYLGSRSR